MTKDEIFEKLQTEVTSTCFNSDQFLFVRDFTQPDRTRTDTV